VTGAFEGPASGFDGADTGGFDGPVTGMFDPLYQENGFDGRGAGGRHGVDSGPLPAEGAGQAVPGEPAGVWRRGRGYSGAEDTGPDAALQAAGAAGMAGEYDIERLYGQIAIYTLLEHGVDEFDRLVEQVVEQVRVREPGTLVYVVHGVPSAPLQRILYEIYRDQAAYDDHARQSYIREFEIGRLPLVLATNVIELGVRQAKVSPIGQPAAAASLKPPLPGPVLPGPVLPGPAPSGPPPSGPPLSGPPLSGPPLSGAVSPGRRSPGRRSSGPVSSEPWPDEPPYGTTPRSRPRGDRPQGGRPV
jgi:quinol monooxygenase YgiN